MKSKRNRSRRGAALVEAGLTLTVFLTFLFSIYDFGWALFFHQTLVHRARSAARYAAINPAGLTEAKNMVLYNQTTAGATPNFGLQTDNVTVTRLSAGTTDDRIQVNVSGYHFVFITFGFAGTHTGRPINVSIPVEN